jgi:hypothetical protein
VNGLLGATEILMSDDEITDWDGTRLAKIRRPRGTARTLFFSAQDWLELAYPDGSLILRTADPGGTTLKSIWVEDPENNRDGVISKTGRLPFSDDFEITGESGQVIGRIRGKGLRTDYVVTDLGGTEVAAGGLQGGTWVIDLSPKISESWERLCLAFFIATEEVSHRLGDTG